MPDLDKALSDIGTIRGQLAAATAFHGYGPVALAATGLLALLTAAGQGLFLDRPSEAPVAFFVAWAVTAALAGLVVWVEMRGRSHRLHSDLAQAMIRSAIGLFLPAVGAGALIGAALFRYAPDALWLLPGLWQILVGLGVFASLRTLPPPIGAVGAWYVIAGAVVLALGAQTRELSPWTMGLPFVLGQLMAAVILHLCSEAANEEA